MNEGQCSEAKATERSCITSNSKEEGHTTPGHAGKHQGRRGGGRSEERAGHRTLVEVFLERNGRATVGRFELD